MNRIVKLLPFALTLALGLSACTPANTSGLDADSQRLNEKVTLPSGTRLRVALQQGIGTDSSEPGSDFSAVLVDPVLVDGEVVLEKGANVVGRVLDVQKPGRVKGRASLSLTLSSVTRDGTSVAITTEPYVGVAKSNTKRDVGVIAGASGVGAAIGAIAGGGKGAATGAAIGGAGGTGAVLATRGDDLHYPPESRINFVLAEPVEL